MYNLDPKSKTPLYMQLYKQIRADIEQGRLAAGSMLISGRKLAETAGVSRNTVELAYEKLLSEGLIGSSPRRGYFVERFAAEKNRETQTEKKKILYDMRADTGCADQFPMGRWRLCVNRVLTDETVLFRRGEPFGEHGLRVEISRFLYRYRGINSSADEVFVFAGEKYALEAAEGIAPQALHIMPFADCKNAADIVAEAESAKKWII